MIDETLPNPHADLFDLELHHPAARHFYIRAHSLRDELVRCAAYPSVRIILIRMREVRTRVVSLVEALNLETCAALYDGCRVCYRAEPRPPASLILAAIDFWAAAVNWYGTHSGRDNMDLW